MLQYSYRNISPYFLLKYFQPIDNVQAFGVSVHQHKTRNFEVFCVEKNNLFTFTVGNKTCKNCVFNNGVL